MWGLSPPIEELTLQDFRQRDEKRFWLALQALVKTAFHLKHFPNEQLFERL